LVTLAAQTSGAGQTLSLQTARGTAQTTTTVVLERFANGCTVEGVVIKK